MASQSPYKYLENDPIYRETTYHLAMLYFMETQQSLNGYLPNQGVADKKLSDQAIYWAEQLRMIEPNQGNFLLAELYNIDDPQLKDSAKSKMYLAKAVDGKFPQALLVKAFAANTGSQKIELPKEAIKLINLAANTGNIQAIHMKAAITIEGDIKTYEEWRMTRDQAFAVMRKNAEKGYVPSIRALIKYDDEQREKWQEIYNKMLSDQEIIWLHYPPLTGSSDKTLNSDETDLVNKSERDKRRLYKSCP